MKTPLKESFNLKAIALGALVAIGLGLLSTLVLSCYVFIPAIVLGLTGARVNFESEAFQFWFTLAAMVLGSLTAMCGGIVTARRTSGTEIRHTIAVSLVLVIGTLLLAWVQPSEPYDHKWDWVGYASCFMPIVGAFVVRRQKRKKQ